MKIKRILVVGAKSTIGAHLLRSSLSERFQIFTTSRELYAHDPNKRAYYLDLEHNQDNLFSYSFDFVIITAGITNTKLCEEEPDFTRLVNVENTINLISKFLDAKSHVIFLSSNSVFPQGIAFPSVKDVPLPRNNYGAQKLEVESFLQANPGNWSILRLTKVIGGKFDLLEKWANNLKMKKVIHAFENVMISPITLLELENGLELILDGNAGGLFHLGGKVECSYYDFAKVYFRNYPGSSKLIYPSVKDEMTNITHNSLTTFLPGHLIKMR